MLTSLFVLAVVAQPVTRAPPSLPVLPPPPVAVVAPPAPPVRIDYEAARVRAREAEPVDVRVTGGPDLLWQGRLTVSGLSEGSFQQNKTDANAGPACPESYRESRRTALSVRLQRRSYGSEATDSYSLQASWERPADDAACPGQGKRTVQLEQTVVLPPGRPVTVQGDGGFAIRLTRPGGVALD